MSRVVLMGVFWPEKPKAFRRSGAQLPTVDSSKFSEAVGWESAGVAGVAGVVEPEVGGVVGVVATGGVVGMAEAGGSWSPRDLRTCLPCFRTILAWEGSENVKKSSRMVPNFISNLLLNYSLEDLDN
jgi:hypothetical protein